MIVELRPAELDRHGLAETLRKHVTLLDRLYPVTITFASAPSGDLPPATEVAVLRVAQEALHNALRHANASSIEVCLQTEGSRLTLEVRDDGDGFEVETPAFRGLGLVSMRDRAEAAGGSLLVSAEQGAGTVVRLEVPA